MLDDMTTRTVFTLPSLQFLRELLASQALPIGSPDFAASAQIAGTAMQELDAAIVELTPAVEPDAPAPNRAQRRAAARKPPAKQIAAKKRTS